MAKSSSDLTNYQRYLNNLKSRGYENLQLPDHQETIDELIAEGNRLLEEDEKKNKISPRVKKSASPSSNPYVRARNQILSEMDPEKRKLIERLEKEGNKNCAQYNDFIEQIRKLGDKL